MSDRAEQFAWTPTSPSSGVGTLDSRGFAYVPPTDENLPEVVPGSAPTTVRASKSPVSNNSPSARTPSSDPGSRSPESVMAHSASDASSDLKALEAGEERVPKYPVVYDQAPKFPSTPESMGDYKPWRSFAPGSPQSSMPWEPLSAINERSAASFGGAGDGKGADEETRICGLRRKIFLLVCVVLLVVVAVAIGGGVGGSIAAGRSRENTQNPATTASISAPSTSTVPTTTSSTATSTSTRTTSTASPTPTTLNNQTFIGNGETDGFAFQAFSQPQWGGNASSIVVQEGPTQLTINASSYVWLPNGTDCCVTFCRNNNATGSWWCDKRFQPNSTGWFNHIYVWCGDPNSSDTLSDKSTCS